MNHFRRIALVIAIAAAAAISATFAFASGGNGSMSSMGSMKTPAAKTSSQAADLRVTLDNLLGEHAVLAMNATNAGITGSKDFSAIAAQLDKNSVALSKAIGSLYGQAAGDKFLNGKFMWRDHIKFFVAYTVALAKHNKAGQTAAVNNLKKYTQKFGAFLAGATGLPTSAVQNDLLGHVLELKNQLDLFSQHKYAKAAQAYDAAYNHMFMTGDTLAAAIAKQKGMS
jgi:hypothetical protein